MKLKQGALAVLAIATTLAFGPNVVLAQGPPPGYQGGGPPPGYQGGQPQPWEVPPSEFQDIQRRGFHDGIEGARKDFQNHRPPNVNNRDEYRHPAVPGPARHDYREAFRRGYNVGVQHIMNGGPR
jgi:hypothetical protein